MADPVSVQRFVQELEKLKGEMDAGKLKHGEYDQRLARVIKELRDRKVDAERQALQTAIDGALAKGTITPGVKTHLEKRLGLT
ncbi:MAG: hypothetical protein A2W29_10830 [Gemmatimonadetes bacterium RBG_16_66_8]|nr:MAG: hypothetical protein A2W29_10830 [Gemmatimonadetes bacterium RBG_16_66_8]